jgi:hypothetical protein
VGALSAQVLALQADREALQERVDRVGEAAGRAEQRAAAREKDLAAAVAREQQERRELASALHREGREKVGGVGVGVGGSMHQSAGAGGSGRLWCQDNNVQWI